MERRTSITSRKPPIFKPQQDLPTVQKTSLTTQPLNPNSMGVGIGAAGGNAGFPTLARASGRRESHPPLENVNPNETYGTW